MELLVVKPKICGRSSNDSQTRETCQKINFLEIFFSQCSYLVKNEALIKEAQNAKLKLTVHGYDILLK